MNHDDGRAPAVVLRLVTRRRLTCWDASCSVCGRIEECRCKSVMVKASRQHLQDRHDGEGRVIDLERGRPNPPPA